MVDYINTGKKVKSTCDGLDLTHDKVYDVFTDGDIEFIIDDVGDWRFNINDELRYYIVETNNKFKEGDKVMVVNTDYISAYDAGVRVGDIGTVIESGVDKYHVKFEGTSYDCDWFFTDNCIELVGDVVETNNKFKEGDKVMLVNTDYISTYTDGVRVGDIGTVIGVFEGEVDKYHVDFKDTAYDCYWWFTDSCIELVDDNIIENTAIVSDGGSSSYYTQQIPKGMLERFNTTGTIEAKDVIRLFLGNDFNMGNIFKAYCRVISLRNGKGKAGIDEQYDLTKAKFFAEDELNSYLENTNAKTRN